MPTTYNFNICDTRTGQLSSILSTASSETQALLQAYDWMNFANIVRDECGERKHLTLCTSANEKDLK